MKMYSKNIALTCIFILLNLCVISQGPPNPPSDPGTGNDPVGGSVPVGSELSVLLLIAGCYGIHKSYKAFLSETDLKK